MLYLLIILSAILQPNFWWLLGIMLLFSWMGLVDVVRAEFLRARNLEYVKAARALGMGNRKIMFRHILPNAMVATLTFLPFILTGAITALTSLDFLGFGLPPGSPSLGELIYQERKTCTRPGWAFPHFSAWRSCLPCWCSSARQFVTHSTRGRTDMGSVLRFDRLTLSFGHDEPAVRDLSFEIYEGETVALVGESGSGKSVSALSVLRLLDHRLVSYPGGSIFYRGEDLLHADEKRLRQVRGRSISMIFQEPMTSLNPLHTVEKQISEILAVHKGLRGPKARERVVELLELVGIPEPRDRLKSYPHQLSGGQKQRVMIAMALANEPDLLIADEPTTALDVTVQKQVLELLKSLQQRFGMAILLITHDLSIVRHYARRVVVMERGTKVEDGETGTVFSKPEHPYTRRLLDSNRPNIRAHWIATVKNSFTWRTWVFVSRSGNPFSVVPASGSMPSGTSASGCTGRNPGHCRRKRQWQDHYRPCLAQAHREPGPRTFSR